MILLDRIIDKGIPLQREGAGWLVRLTLNVTLASKQKDRQSLSTETRGCS